jgi:hypothetical protein
MSETPSGDEELEPASVEPVSETPSEMHRRTKEHHARLSQLYYMA